MPTQIEIPRPPTSRIPSRIRQMPEIVEWLIHVLDEHNGLVRLFRTAHDRCNASDIPSFKLRLYNMGGVDGYELPIADVLGTIMFENGPRSRIDFDVIIEFRGGPPQRINKLYQSYMSLQFPLLFIFGQPGLLLGLYDAVSRGDHEGIASGSKIMLPNTFTGGPRLIHYRVLKRGLPHYHTLLWIESRNTLKDATRIDEYIFAEIPDPMQDHRAVQILNVHLEDMQHVNFHERDRLDIIVNIPGKKKTTLTEWFVYNNENSEIRDLTYLNFLRSSCGTRIQNNGDDGRSGLRSHSED
uniref:Helitron helicase-like domain-containing protein n=1 Tax=Tanacetum cinerariifolium TaxID=118510 RepID=A0A6L2MDR1_TANCI|nr:helitron helicase-like domain-containing protein [Tanacetum cinerariifolium]